MQCSACSTIPVYTLNLTRFKSGLKRALRRPDHHRATEPLLEGFHFSCVEKANKIPTLTLPQNNVADEREKSKINT